MHYWLQVAGGGAAGGAVFCLALAAFGWPTILDLERDPLLVGCGLLWAALLLFGVAFGA